MKPLALRGAATCFAALVLSWLPAAAAQADVLPPEPKTAWTKGQAPAARSIAIAGGCLAAAVIAAGLLAARVRSVRVVAAAGSLLLVAAIAAGALGFYWQAEKDREAWQQYEQAVKNRRWTPPPDFRGGPAPEPVPPPAPASSP